jgi:hypothetical protein
LKYAEENWERRHAIRALGYDFEWLTDKVTDMCGITPRELLTGGKQRKTVLARSLLCYWGTRELGMSAVDISKKLGIAPSTASECVTRGRKIVEEKGLKLLDEGIQIRITEDVPDDADDACLESVLRRVPAANFMRID